MGGDQLATEGEVVEGSDGEGQVSGMRDLLPANQSVSADGSGPQATGEDGRLQRPCREQPRASTCNLQQPEGKQA